jgi:hypothetical protein
MIIDPTKEHRRTYCPRCKKDSEELLVYDAAMMLYVCPVCSMKYYGGLPGTCQKCGNSTYGVIGRPLDELEKIPNLCHDCEVELRDWEDEVKRGGIFFTCKRCSRSGVIHAKADFAKRFRSQVGITAPNLCGVELEICPECRKRGLTDGQG